MQGVSRIRLGIVSVQVSHQLVRIVIVQGTHETMSVPDHIRNVGVDKGNCTVEHALVPQVQIVTRMQWLKFHSYNRPHRVLAEEQIHAGQPGLPVFIADESGDFEGDEVLVVGVVHEELHMLHSFGLLGDVFSPGMLDYVFGPGLPVCVFNQ